MTAEQLKIYNAEVAKADAARQEKDKLHIERRARLEAYPKLTNPTQQQQVQQLIDMQEQKTLDDKSKAAIDAFDKTIHDIEHRNDLDNALQKDHLNRKLGIY